MSATLRASICGKHAKSRIHCWASEPTIPLRQSCGSASPQCTSLTNPCSREWNFSECRCLVNDFVWKVRSALWHDAMQAWRFSLRSAGQESALCWSSTPRFPWRGRRWVLPPPESWLVHYSGYCVNLDWRRHPPCCNNLGTTEKGTLCFCRPIPLFFSMMSHLSAWNYPL